MADGCASAKKSVRYDAAATEAKATVGGYRISPLLPA